MYKALKPVPGRFRKLLDASGESLERRAKTGEIGDYEKCLKPGCHSTKCCNRRAILDHVSQHLVEHHILQTWTSDTFSLEKQLGQQRLSRSFTTLLLAASISARTLLSTRRMRTSRLLYFDQLDSMCSLELGSITHR